MLHILLLILKIIGIILAVILGILILLVCIILFVPIRYEISAKCDGTIDSLKAKVIATWLLHFVRADVFLKGKKVKWRIRAAWFKRTNAVMETKRKEENESKENESASDVIIPEEPQKAEESPKAEESAVKEEVNEEIPKIVEENIHSDEKTADTAQKESISEKIKKIIEKIKSSIKSACEKIKELLQKKEKISDFLTEESHVNAFKKIKKEVIILLKKLKPKKVDIKLRYGFEDPCTTGQVLGGLSLLYPFFGDTTEIIPDFENQILKGTVYLKGRIRFCHFAVLALRLLFCKDIRILYKDIRNFKL